MAETKPGDAARETANLGVAQALGITPEAATAAKIGATLAEPDNPAKLAGAFADPDTSKMFVTVVDKNGEAKDIPVSDAEAAGLVGAATTPPKK